MSNVLNLFKEDQKVHEFKINKTRLENKLFKIIYYSSFLLFFRFNKWSIFS